MRPSGADHAILQPGRIHERIRRVQQTGLLTGTRFCGRAHPMDPVPEVSDFILLHGNGVSSPEGILQMIRKGKDLSRDISVCPVTGAFPPRANADFSDC